MSSIENIEAKLKLTGAKIILKNDFGIIYQSTGKEKQCIKITKTRKGIVITKESNISTISVSKHFIVLFDYELNAARIFVRNNPNNIALGIGEIYYISSYGKGAGQVFGWKIPWDSSIILVVSMENRLYMVNYSGKIMDITPKVQSPKPMIATMKFDSNKHRFYVGYGSERNATRPSTQTDYTIDRLILKTDRNFKNIEYFDTR